MPQGQQDRETVTVEQIALTNMYQFEALLNVLERKGMVTSHQFLSMQAQAIYKAVHLVQARAELFRGESDE